MEIFVPKIPFVSGFVKIATFYKEDILQMEPKQYQECDNTIEDFLLESIMDHMQSSSGSTGYHLDTSGWHVNKYPGNVDDQTTAGETLNQQKDGILVLVSDTTGFVKKNSEDAGNNNLIKDFALTDNITAAAGDSNNKAVWSAQAEWGTGTSGDLSLGPDTTVGHLYIGKFYQSDGSAQGSTDGGALRRFRDKFANTDVASFTLETDDVLKVTWTITVG